MTYNNIAVVYRDQGDYVKAIEYCKKALEIREKVLGTNHPDTLDSMYGLAKLLEDKGDAQSLKEAEELWLKIKDIKSKTK